MKRLILFLGILLAGCSHMVMVQLSPEDYSPPAQVPFTDPKDKELYLMAHKKGWMDIATNYWQKVDLVQTQVISRIVGPGFHGSHFPKAMHDGRMDGITLAEDRLDNLADQVFIDAGMPPFWEPYKSKWEEEKKANNRIHGIGEELAEP